MAAIGWFTLAGSKDSAGDEGNKIPLTPFVNKTGLKAALDTANAAKNSVAASINGSDALKSTISSVQAIFDNEEVSQSVVDLATATLLTAVNTFYRKKESGE